MKAKNKKALVIFGGLATVAAGIYFIFKDDNSPMGEFVRKITGKQLPNMEHSYSPEIGGSVISAENPITVSGGCTSYVSEAFPLKKCMKGSNVAAMQTILNELYADKIGSKIKVDKYFGSDTESALIKATGKSQLSEQEYLSLASAADAKSNISGGDDSWFSGLFV